MQKDNLGCYLAGKNLEVIYTHRIRQFEAKAAELKTRYDRLSWLRLIFFIAGIGLIILLWSWNYGAGILATFLFLFGFYRFVLWHQHILQQAKHQQNLANINKWEEQVVLQHDYTPFFDGADFLDQEHPYALDLDIFGPFSFYQYVNRTTTVLGQQNLANYLTNVVDKEEIQQRQRAIQEISSLLDWRQNLQAHGLDLKDDPKHIKLLKLWLTIPPLVSIRPFYKIAIWLMPLWIILGGVLCLYLPWQVFLGFLLVPGLILQRTVKTVNDIHLKTTYAEEILASYARLIAHIEQHSFASPKLIALQAHFLKEKQSASKAIQRLSYIIAQLNVRYNIFAVLLNLFSLWDLKWVWQLEKWQASHGKELAAWFDSMSEFEVISSLGNLLHNNSEWVFPDLLAEREPLRAVQLGHPLIAPNKRVCNDIQIPSNGHIKLVTGSNMAGKSTFLRTVGLNIVLANMGAPTCAQSFSLPLLKVYTSMRTVDALHESTSSFYAELKRLKFIIEAVETQSDIFFLLDEILKGTNSRDRHTGSKALIRQLIKGKSSGIIATHDLELGALEATAGGTIENLRMEVAIKDNELFFDYLLQKGVSESFNATLLMKNMGIRIAE